MHSYRHALHTLESLKHSSLVAHSVWVMKKTLNLNTMHHENNGKVRWTLQDWNKLKSIIWK